MNFAYIVVLFFGVSGSFILLHDIPGLLLYHKKVQAKVKAGKRYVVTNPVTEQKNKSSGQYGKPNGHVHVKSAVFTYEENGKDVMATAVNLVGDDNLYLNSNEIYTVKVSPFDPHRCYFPAIQLYRGCSIPAMIFIFVMRLLPKLGALMFLGIAWLAYTNFILK